MKKILLLIIVIIMPINVYSIKYTIDHINVYISKNYINVNKGDVLIIDDRKNNDIKIIDSYKINNSEFQNKIISLILKYNKDYPNNNWIRTRKSMKLEWFIHNLLYKFNICKKNTKSVDFSIKEEIIYNFLNNYLQIKKNMVYYSH